MASRTFGLILLLVSLIVLTWGVRSVTYRTQTVPVTLAELSSPAGNRQLPGFGTNPNQIVGRLFLEWPESLRLGDAGEVRLSFNPEIPVGAQAPQPETSGGANQVLQSRLELAGIAYTPTGEISQALSMAHPVIFLWNLRARQMGDFSGTTWLHLSEISANGSQTGNTGKSMPKVLSAQQIDVPVNTFWGLSGIQARILGGVGLAVGAVLGLGSLFFQALQAIMEGSRNKGKKQC